MHDLCCEQYFRFPQQTVLNCLLSADLKWAEIKKKRRNIWNGEWIIFHWLWTARALETFSMECFRFIWTGGNCLSAKSRNECVMYNWNHDWPHMRTAVKRNYVAQYDFWLKSRFLMRDADASAGDLRTNGSYLKWKLTKKARAEIPPKKAPVRSKMNEIVNEIIWETNSALWLRQYFLFRFSMCFSQMFTLI